MAVDITLVTIILKHLRRLEGNPVTADALACVLDTDFPRHKVSVDRVRDALLAARDRHLVTCDENMWGEQVWEITEEGEKA